jgi:hypothetical protein
MFKVGDIIVPDKAKSFRVSRDWYTGSAPIKHFNKARVRRLFGNSEAKIELIGGRYNGNIAIVKINNNRFKLEDSENNYEIY